MNLVKGANGKLVLRFGSWGLWRAIEVQGGPFAMYKPGEWSTNSAIRPLGVSLLESPPTPATAINALYMPIEDFSVPRDQALVELVVKRVIKHAMSGGLVYVGCMAGRGRTGLFLSLLAKIAGETAPVAYVRKHYYRHAVETSTQEAYVAAFDVRPYRGWLLRTAFSTLV